MNQHAGILNRSRATAKDLELLDLIHFFPGVTVLALSMLTGNTKYTVRERARILCTAGFAYSSIEPRGGCRPHERFWSVSA